MNKRHIMASGNPAYLMAYFRSGPKQTDMTRKLHYAFSRDGLHWYELNDNKAVWATPAGGGIIRDPFINKGPDGFYHLVHTMHSSPDSSDKGKQIGYARSKDLISFTDTKALTVMGNFPDTVNSWAPEWNWDEETGRYMIHWSSTLNSSKPDNNRIYKAYTNDWNELTPAELLFDPGYSVIDSNITHHEGSYHLFFKDESVRPMRNRYATSDSLGGGYAGITAAITPGVTEGAEVLNIPGRQAWLLYYDYWADGAYGVMKSVDMLHWSEELPAADCRFPYQRRHATFFHVTEEELFKLIYHYSLIKRLGKNEGEGCIIDDRVMQEAFSLRTVSMWVKADEVQGTQMLYVEGDADAGFAVKIEEGILQAAAAGREATPVTVSAAFTDTASWHHVAVVFTEGSLELYLDGELRDSARGGFARIDEHHVPGGLGRRIAQDAFGEQGNGATFDGLLDHVEIFNTSLQAEDVSYLFQWGIVE